jgi:Fe-S cluster assembly protein SufD
MSELATQFSAALRENSNSGPQWLMNLRQSGAEQFRAHGLPTRKDEAWKYTGLGVLEQADVQLALVSGTESAGTGFPAPLVETGVQVKMLDGRLLEQNGELPEGLTVLALTDALDGDIDGLQNLLESLTGTRLKPGSTHGFSALNTATLDAGVVVHVAAGIDAGRVLLNWASLSSAETRLFNSRVCVILEQGAKLELLEQFENQNANTSNVVFQIELNTGAKLQHIRFQQESDTAVLITRTEVSQQGDSDYNYYGFDLGGRLVRHDLHSSLLGRGAKAGLNGAYLLDGNRHVDNHCRVDHMAVGGVSEQYFRGIAGGNGRAVFNTAVCVHPGADETEARQSNANILLSTRAEIDTKPELEIYADEVIASHGATVGQLDEQAIFYMRSRGLSEQQARQLLTTAFCRSVSDKLPDSALGEVIAQRMMDVMPQAD